MPYISSVSEVPALGSFLLGLARQFDCLFDLYSHREKLEVRAS